ncbi:MAG: hypothetical protein VB060_05930 [Oscillibacter sp.]|nr:hypothetical protein [Oscillibacter sp.]MEA4993363.1 hypothetical protein [Oscillibacter sp.]
MDELEKKRREIDRRVPCNPGGVRFPLYNAIAGYIDFLCFQKRKVGKISRWFRVQDYAGIWEVKPVMKHYPVAYERLIDAVAREARKLKEEKVPPFDQFTIPGKEEIKQSEQSDMKPELPQCQRTPL